MPADALGAALRIFVRDLYLALKLDKIAGPPRPVESRCPRCEGPL